MEIKDYRFVLQHFQIQCKYLSGYYECKNVSVIIVQHQNNIGNKFGLH